MGPGTLWDEGDAAVRPISLVRLSAEIARSVAGLGRVLVEGEVVRPKQHPGGIYFTLRDRAAQISVRCPASRLARCRAVGGERVAVTASPEWAPDRGHLQLVAEEVVPVGAGAIAAAISDRRRRLADEGLLDRRRRAIPRLPSRIGVICGREAAVRDDIDSVVASRFPGYPVTYLTTNVSGPGAADAVIESLRTLDRHPEVDVILLARGGGDAAQLLPFSDEALCRAICASCTPVASAIGHHADAPLCDEVADARFATPSLAATALVPDRQELIAELDGLSASRRAAIERVLAASRHRLAAVDRHRALRAGCDLAAERLCRASGNLRLLHPKAAVRAAAARLGRVGWRAALDHRMREERQRLLGHRRHLDALSPARVLRRGYAVVRAGDGSVVRDAGTVRPGALLEVQLAEGALVTRVEQVRNGPPDT